MLISNHTFSYDMNEFIKQLFGPSWKQALLKMVLGFVLLFIVTFTIAMNGSNVSEWSYGWPFSFLDVNENDPSGTVFRPVGLIANLVFWYVMVCVVDLILRKTKSST